MASTVKTRVLIVSDTHGLDFDSIHRPLQRADVAIHCGDMTEGSKLEEFQTTIQILKNIDAPLKLAIAGNHDFTLDLPAFQRKVAEAMPPLDPELVAKEYGTHGEAKRLFEDAAAAGIHFLEEGTYSFRLENGALLKVYASPFSPSLGAWGFQYHPERGHKFSMEKDIDIAVTHGPPKGILDFTHGRERAGCPSLFAAVARARPLLHCFGHIHESWGARAVAWRDSCSGPPTHFTAIDNNRSHFVERLSSLSPSKFDTNEDIAERERKVARYENDKCCTLSYCAGSKSPLERGLQTLFVNASCLGDDGRLTQYPWLIDVDLRNDMQT